MPIDPSIYQSCEALDIPVEYIDEYETQAASKQFEWGNFLPVFFILLVLPLIIVFVSGYLLVTFGSRF